MGPVVAVESSAVFGWLTPLIALTVLCMPFVAALPVVAIVSAVAAVAVTIVAVATAVPVPARGALLSLIHI